MKAQLTIKYPLYAKIDIATATNHTIIAAPGTGKKIAIAAVFAKSAGSNTATWKDGSTAITGAISEAANSGEVVRFGPDSPLLLSDNQAFVITLGSAVQLSGVVVYGIVVD